MRQSIIYYSLPLSFQYVCCLSVLPHLPNKEERVLDLSEWIDALNELATNEVKVVFTLLESIRSSSI